MFLLAPGVDVRNICPSHVNPGFDVLFAGYPMMGSRMLNRLEHRQLFTAAVSTHPLPLFVSSRC